MTMAVGRKAGDNLTLEFITSEAVSSPSILIAANSRLADNLSLDGKQWETIYEVLPGDNGTVNWDFTVRDLAGNVSDNVTQDNASLITMDTSAPVISEVMFVSDNSKNSSYAKVGDNLIFKYETNEAVEDTELVLSDSSLLRTYPILIGHSSSTGNHQWESVYQVDNDSSKWGSNSAGRIVTYELFATDYAGNIGTESFDSVGTANEITVDIIDPVISQVSLSIRDKNIPIAKAGDTD